MNLRTPSNFTLSPFLYRLWLLRLFRPVGTLCPEMALRLSKALGRSPESWLAMQGNDRLKLGKIEAVDDDTITVEIVTIDDSLVQKLAVDRHNGWTRPAK